MIVASVIAAAGFVIASGFRRSWTALALAIIAAGCGLPGIYLYLSRL